MATKYAEFPVEETDKFIYGVAPAQGPAQAPVQVQAQPLVPGPVAPTAPPTAPVAKTPNASNLVKKVAEANKQLQEQMPAPEPQSATQNLVGDITKNWQSLLPLAGIPAIAWLANKAFGGESESGGKPKEPPKSIADRSIRKAEPLMDVNQKPPTGPVEPEFAKPTPSVVKVSRDPIEQRLFEISQAQQAAKTQPPMMGQPAPVAPPLFNLMGQPLDKTFAEFVPPPSVESLDKARAASIASPVVQTAPVTEEFNRYMNIGATPAAGVAPTEEPPKPAAETKKTGGRPTKQAVAAEMEGKVFKEGFGGADNYLEKQFGPDIRRFMKDEFNQGKPYGGGQAAMDKAYADIKKYDTWLKENIPVQTLNREERKAMGVPPPKDYPVLGKAMKVGGAAGLLMTAGQAANAREAMGNVAEALLPLGMTPSQLATGKLTEKQLEAYKEAQKLGSPYRSVPPR
jgi:hypothetical protein